MTSNDKRTVGILVYCRPEEVERLVDLAEAYGPGRPDRLLVRVLVHRDAVEDFLADFEYPQDVPDQIQISPASAPIPAPSKRVRETKTEQPKGQLKPGTMRQIRGELVYVTTKTGQSKRGPWTLYRLGISGDDGHIWWCSTFDNVVGKIAQELKDNEQRPYVQATLMGTERGIQVQSLTVPKLSEGQEVPF